MDLAELTKKVDLFCTIRNQRLDADKEAAALKKQETELKDEIIAHMEESGSYNAGGHVGAVERHVKPKASIKNWPEVYEFIKEHDAFDILYRRVNEKAITDRQELGEVVPGIEWFPVSTLSVSKGVSK